MHLLWRKRGTKHSVDNNNKHFYLYYEEQMCLNNGVCELARASSTQLPTSRQVQIMVKIKASGTESSFHDFQRPSGPFDLAI